MFPHMLGQLAGALAQFATRVTDMPLPPRMRPHVCSQVAGCREGLAAHLADMRYARRLSISSVGFSAIEISSVL
jgi:hypothetical protein